jgi:hypothetical protein
MAVDPNTKPLEEWVQEAVKQQPLNTASADEMDLRLLSVNCRSVRCDTSG